MKKNQGVISFVFLLLFFLFFSTALVLAPAIPHSIAGFIFNGGTKQVPLNTAYSINDTNNSRFIRGKTSIPVPGLSGRYFEVINGTNNDSVIVSAWNLTNYGRTTAKLWGDMDNVNVTLSYHRNVELNVTITFPYGNKIFYIPNFYNVSAKIKILGANGQKCNVTISFSHPEIINISNGEFFTHSLGNPARGTLLATSWNISANSGGSTNITVTGMCLNEGLYFEANKKMTVKNITAKDITPPVVRLIGPANNTIAWVSRNIIFFYNVTDASGIKNCSLILNKKINRTNTTPIVKNKKLNFTAQISNGRYNWSVRCFDAFSNLGLSGVFNLTVAVFPPSFMHHVVASPVNLVSGSKINISCNASVVHGYSSTQVSKINATFYFSTSSSTAANDNNYHYTDSNCTIVASTSNTRNVSCVFELYYYANSGSWYCNITAFTLANLTNSSVAPATVEDLYAIGADPILDYGSLGPGMLSADKNLSLYNFGNRDINITVEGYGKVKDDNLSMGCYPKGNISSRNERYSIKYQSQFSLMANLSSRPKLIKNLVLAHRTNDYIYSNDTNKTFWKLSMPLGLRGSCNGTIIFSAIVP